MAITSLAQLQLVPDKFNSYVTHRITDKLTLVRRGIATGNPQIAQLINGTPKGGRVVELPYINPLSGDDYTFGEGDENDKEATGITTGNGTASLLIRWHMWGDTDLSQVLGGIDPMAAVGNLIGDWWAQKEQAIYLSVLKGILDPTAGALRQHVNDVSSAAGDAGLISVGNTLNTKQALGDAASILGAVYMHSATYTYLQKNQQIATEYDATLQISINTYLGYEVIVDDGMPYTAWETATSSESGAIAITTANIGFYQPHCEDTLTAGTSYVKALANPIYETYFLGAGALAREDGVPQGLVTTETDRDKVLGNNYLIHRRCMIVHPNGFSWAIPARGARYTNSNMLFPNNADLATPANWSLIDNHKRIPIACLRHKIG